MQLPGEFEVHAIPFEGRYIVYRPLLSLAFVANERMVQYIGARLAGADASEESAEEFLQAAGFWEPYPPVSTDDLLAYPHLPTAAVLLMTTRCNLRCTYCYADAGATPLREMSLDLGRVVIDEAYANAAELGADRFSLTFHGGGEPTQNWDVLVAATEYARSREMPCQISMSSNGVWSGAQRDWIIAKIDDVSLSPDGLQAVHDAQRPRPNGSGSNDAVTDSIRAMEGAGLSYGIRMTVTPEFFDTIPASIAHICEITTSAPIQIEPAYHCARGEYSGPSGGDGEQFAGGFLEGFRIAARAGRQLYYSGARPWTITPTFCTAPYRALVATPEGDLVTCYEVTDRNHPMADTLRIGRVSVENGVQVERKRLAAEFERQRDRRAACEGCFCYWHCGGDCVTRCGDGEAKQLREGRCAVNRAIARDLIAWYIATSDGLWHRNSEFAMGAPHTPPTRP